MEHSDASDASGAPGSSRVASQSQHQRPSIRHGQPIHLSQTHTSQGLPGGVSRGVAKSGAIHQAASHQRITPAARSNAEQKRPHKSSWVRATRAARDRRISAFLKAQPPRSNELEKIEEMHFNHGRFIIDLGFKLQLEMLPISTAAVFFHRFFTLNEIGRADPFITALACLFLAAKVEEDARKAEHVVTVGFRVYHGRQLVRDSTEYERLIQNMLDAEIQLLMCVSFELDLEHSHMLLLDTVDTLRRSSGLTDEQAHRLKSKAWAVANESLKTTLCVQYHPRTIAVVAIYIASGFFDDFVLRSTPRHGPPASASPATPSSPQSPERFALDDRKIDEWWKTFGCSNAFVEDIAAQINKVIERGSGGNEGSRRASPSQGSDASVIVPSLEQCAPDMHDLHDLNVYSRDDASSPLQEPHALASSDPSPASPTCSTSAPAPAPFASALH